MFVPGALFEIGDGHAAQGDGEVDQTAIETSLRGKVQLTVRKGLKLVWPRAETPTDYIAMATDPDLTVATTTRRGDGLGKDRVALNRAIAVAQGEGAARGTRSSRVGWPAALVSPTLYAPLHETKMMDEFARLTNRRIRALALVALLAPAASPAWAQAVGGAEAARPVSGDPGISSMVVTETPDYRVFRDYAEPGATRRMHKHADATWHVFTLVTGNLTLTVEGAAPIEVSPGQVLSLKGGVNHTFKSTGTVTATIVEVFGKAKP